MLGRRTALAVVVASAAAFGVAGAVAATHGGGAHALKPPKLLPMKQPATNVRIPCHSHHAISASL